MLPSEKPSQPKVGEKSPINVQFVNGVNIGGQVVSGCSIEKHQVKMEKSNTGLWVYKEGYPDRWIPDGNIRFIEFK